MPSQAQADLRRAGKLEKVVLQLRATIARHKLQPGDRLPAERDLATQLGATRGDIRRALGYLAALGVLDVRHGAGAFLSHAETAGRTAPPALPTTRRFETWQMFEARQALETTLVALAAQRAHPADLTRLAQELAAMAASLENPGDFLIHDIRFHRAIAAASGNPLLAALMEDIAGSLYEERQRVAGTALNRATSLKLHRTIFNAIAQGNPDSARKAMARHLQSAESALTP